MEKPPIPDHSEIWRAVHEQFACSHSQSEVRSRITKHGAQTYYRQCVRCGQSMGQVSTHTLSDCERELCSVFDEDQSARWQKAKTAQADDMKLIAEEQYIALVEAYNKWAEEETTQWRRRYSEYIHSSEWQRKRTLVLERDNYLCQACLLNKAYDIHHLTYQHLTQEFMWELVSVCRSCHEEIHQRPIG